MGAYLQYHGSGRVVGVGVGPPLSGVGVAVGTGVFVGVGPPVGGFGVGVGVATGVGVGVGVDVGVGPPAGGVGVGVGVDVGLALDAQSTAAHALMRPNVQYVPVPLTASAVLSIFPRI